MIRNLLIRGMIAGLVAGLLGFCFAKTFGEPSVDRAIAFESQQEQARGYGDWHEIDVKHGAQTSAAVHSAAAGDANSKPAVAHAPSYYNTSTAFDAAKTEPAQAAPTPVAPASGRRATMSRPSSWT